MASILILIRQRRWNKIIDKWVLDGMRQADAEEYVNLLRNFDNVKISINQIVEAAAFHIDTVDSRQENQEMARKISAVVNAIEDLADSV